jgi:hypothetical protein
VQGIGGETTLFGRTLRKLLNHHQRASCFLDEAPLAHGSPVAAKGVEPCLEPSVTRSRSALSSPSHRKAGHLGQAGLEGWLMVSVNSMTSPNTFVPAFTGQSAAPVLFALSKGQLMRDPAVYRDQKENLSDASGGVRHCPVTMKHCIKRMYSLDEQLRPHVRFPNNQNHLDQDRNTRSSRADHASNNQPRRG